MAPEEEGSKVRVLIDKATNSTASEVDPRLLKAIKSVVRYSDSELRIAAQTLLDLMKRDHSQVRYLSLLIIDELFMRSKLFRTLVVENLDQLLSLSVGFRRNLPLPAPPAIASILRSKGIEFLEKWNDTFGIHYKQLRLGFNYLKNTLRFQFPNIQANAARLQQERRERERRSKEILLNKYEMLKEKFSSIKGEIHSTIDEIEQCLEILHSKVENDSFIPLDEEEFDEYLPPELWQIRLDALKQGEKVHEDSDNKVVFDALRELYKLLVTKHLISIQEWISVLLRVEVLDNRFRDSTLKEFIDIRNKLQLVKKKCEEVGCTIAKSTKSDEEEEVFWEEGNIISMKNSCSSAPGKKDEDVASTSHAVSQGLNASSDRESRGSYLQGPEVADDKNDKKSLRSKLLAEAPVVNWDTHLDNWGSDRLYMANQRGLEIDNHWGRVDEHAVIPSDKIAELSVHVTLYKEEPIKTQPCRAPLRKGELCQRRDLRICPFHGPIIPRDDEGKPLNQSPLAESVNSELGAELVEQLAKQAVKKVRNSDKETAKKRELDKQALKRAKLAKIREHNESILQNAALSSTSTAATLGDKLSSRNKKQSLSTMLHKKVTAKDRISQKLLNSRTTDSTIRQLTTSEDANYREAFPNQW